MAPGHFPLSNLALKKAVPLGSWQSKIIMGVHFLLCLKLILKYGKGWIILNTGVIPKETDRLNIQLGELDPGFS